MMTDYQIALQRSPVISDEEARRRLGQVYRLLLDLARQKRAAEAQAGEAPAADSLAVEPPAPGALPH